MSSPEVGLLGKVVLGFPKPLEYTDSSSSTVARAQCGGQLEQIPLWNGSNLSSSLVLDAASGQLDPLSSFCFCFTVFFFSVYFVLLSGFWPLCLLCSSLELFSNLTRAFCLYSWLLVIRNHAYSVPLPPLSIHLLQLCLEFPVRCQHERSGSGHLSSSKQRQPTSSVHFFNYVMDEVFPPPWQSNGFQILLKRGVFLHRFHFLHQTQS